MAKASTLTWDVKPNNIYCYLLSNFMLFFFFLKSTVFAPASRGSLLRVFSELTGIPKIPITELGILHFTEQTSFYN